MKKEIFVYEEKDGNDTYMVANPKIEDCFFDAQKRRIGVYVLKETVEATAKTVVSTKKLK